jgi:magnesium transporter
MARNPTRTIKTLVEGFCDLYPGEAAKLLEGLPAKEATRLLQALPAPRALAVFEKMIPDFGAEILGEMGSAAPRVLSGLDPMRAAALLARLDLPARESCLAALPAPVAKELGELMSYPPDTAGALMDPRVVTFHPDVTVKDALTRLRGVRERRVHNVYLVGEDGQLICSVALQELATAAPNQTLENLPAEALIFVRSVSSREEILELIEQHKVSTLAVTDASGRLLGAIHSAALALAAQEETSADIQTMVGVSKEERALSKPLFAVRKRLPWLQINLVTAFIAASVVGLFEDTISRSTALAVLLPVVAGQSGNTGAQALAVTMRGLALREIRVRNWLKIVLKEVTAGFLNGVLVALTTSIVVYMWSRSEGLAFVIGISMVLSMVAAGLAGAAIPMALEALGQDPAQSSSIILTTVTDVVGFFSFLGIATLLANRL